VQASDSEVASAVSRIQAASFIAWDETFLDVIGPHAKVETIQTFRKPESKHVHEAPAYIPETNELIYSDTSMVGVLWAIDIDTHAVTQLQAHYYLEA